MKYERTAEYFRLNDETYRRIQRTAKDKVNFFLTEYNGRKLLESALAAVVQALRQDLRRELLIENMPPVEGFDFDPEKVFHPHPSCLFLTCNPSVL
jgi:hypothetical protein